jgi:hypothetical protein
MARLEMPSMAKIARVALAVSIVDMFTSIDKTKPLLYSSFYTPASV